MASQLAPFVFLLIILLLTLLAARRRYPPLLRSIDAFAALPDQIGRAAESGQTIHLSLGTGGVGGADTVASLAGLSALAYLADQGAATDTPPLVTVSDPTLLLLAQNVVRRAYARQGHRSDLRGAEVRLVSPAPMAYALGTMHILSHEPVLANVMLGNFGPEVGLIARAGDAAGLAQISGSDDLQALAVLQASTDHVAVGEELFAVGAYLRRTPALLTSLAAEDVARVILILFVIVSALLQASGAL